MIREFTLLYNRLRIKQSKYRVLELISHKLSSGFQIAVNLIIPMYFKLTAHKKKNSLNYGERIDVIVSLTSFPTRINKVWLVIETILRQSVKPYKIILWLSKDQFANKSQLPKRLLRLENRGLSIKLRDGDLRSFKKFYYNVIECENYPFITLDDDKLYYSDVIKSLYETSLSFPDCICCNHSRIYLSDGDDICRYKQWPINNKSIHQPEHNIIPIGVGGVLYPKNIFYKDVADKEIFMNLCPTGDDLWLKVMTNLNNVKAVQTKLEIDNLSILYRVNQTLESVNINNDNDIQIEKLINYYGGNAFRFK